MNERRRERGRDIDDDIGFGVPPRTSKVALPHGGQRFRECGEVLPSAKPDLRKAASFMKRRDVRSGFRPNSFRRTLAALSGFVLLSSGMSMAVVQSAASPSPSPSLSASPATAAESPSTAAAPSATPARPVTAPKAVFTPRPEYRQEWARRGLTGKGVVLVTIDKQTGKVTGAEMLQSTGNKLLDGSALEAYSRWRFDPSTVTVSQLKIPIAFAKRPAPQPAKRTLPQPVIVLIVLAIAGAAIGFLKRRRA